MTARLKIKKTNKKIVRNTMVVIFVKKIQLKLPKCLILANLSLAKWLFILLFTSPGFSMRNLSLITMGTILASLFWGCATSPQLEMSEEVSPPNVLLILTDDQGWGDLGIHGNPIIQTPVLDAFARGGVRVENFYVSPLCAPTRASLLTGRYHLRTGTRWVSDGLENMNPEEVTLAEIFQAAGYATGCFGKWHNGAHYPFHPNQQGFDEFIGF